MDIPIGIALLESIMLTEEILLAMLESVRKNPDKPLTINWGERRIQQLSEPKTNGKILPSGNRMVWWDYLFYWEPKAGIVKCRQS